MNLAHGLGASSDLPIPASLAGAGGTAALAVSFIVLLYAWRSPRYNDTMAGTPAPWLVATVVGHRAFGWTLRLAGLLVLGFVVWAAVAGRDLATNPTFGIVYVWLWVGIVPASLLFGPWFKAVSRARTTHLVLTRLTGGDPGKGMLPYPPRLGYWPAALGLLAFVWMELVYPGGSTWDRCGRGSPCTPRRYCSAAPCSALAGSSAQTRSRCTRRSSAIHLG
ncbi:MULTISPECIES: hypothetical protein [unclassified Nocardioides]|uniref:hypothetical protein n=1 Tax=unclassified Nocardioides TaxID=2615069 RepID=UPI0009F151F9|nr:MULTISPECIES: hypothetical protein [unclassified Nocardioides]GAW49712.1 uncharacterized protein PD653B2_2039 [Nocardioides sp. PD653-B2]GAW56548.1 uncharacterized protein PD653_3985 [Nocardioides sp. PD653]